MSAFIVSREHIAYLVNALSTFDRWHTYMPEECENLGQILWDENIRSVRYRYPDAGDSLPGPIGEKFEYQHTYRLPTHVDPVQTLKAVSCLEYQSCEHPEWRQESNPARRLCEKIRSAAIAALPGYEAAAWELSS